MTDNVYVSGRLELESCLVDESLTKPDSTYALCTICAICAILSRYRKWKWVFEFVEPRMKQKRIRKYLDNKVVKVRCDRRAEPTSLCFNFFDSHLRDNLIKRFRLKQSNFRRTKEGEVLPTRRGKKEVLVTKKER